MNATPYDLLAGRLKRLGLYGLLGQLAEGQIACLQNRIRTARLQTTKNKLSRLLLVDAEAKGDPETAAQWRQVREKIRILRGPHES